MPNDTMTKLFLAIPGTQETRELDMEEVRSGVARGDIPLDNWAWSPQRSEWMPLSQLPEFATEVATPVVPVQPMRVEPTKVEPAQAVMPAQTVRVGIPVAATGNGQMPHAATYYSRPIEEHHEFPIFKVLFFILGVAIVALVVVNYYLVEQPFRANMVKTPFADVQAHAHLGAFVQPNVLLIHILPNREINSDNFADLLTALTQSAPHQAIPGHPFQTISLTPLWLGEYAIAVGDWSGFADMGGYSAEEKKQFVLTHLEFIDGEPLVHEARNATSAQRKAREDQAWTELVSKFQGT